MNLSKLYQDTAEVYAALAKDENTPHESSDNGVEWFRNMQPGGFFHGRFRRLVKQPTAEELRVAANAALVKELGHDGWKLCEYRHTVGSIYHKQEWSDWKLAHSWCGFDNPRVEYRKKPEPKLVPFTFADELCGKVFTLKTDGEPARSMATRQDRFGVYLAIGQVWYADLLTGWTLDGRPAGKEQA